MDRNDPRMPELPAEIVEAIAMKLVDVDASGRLHVHVRARAKMSLANRQFR